MVAVKGSWYAIYRKNGKQTRKLLGAVNERKAAKLRDEFFALLVEQGATTYTGRTVADKLTDNPDLYIYKRPSYSVVVKGKLLGFTDFKAEARSLRDEYLKGN